MKLAEQMEEISQRKLSPRGVRETMIALYREAYGDTIPTATTRAYIANWLKTKSPEVAGSTLAFCRKGVAKFIEFLGPAADLDISTVSEFVEIVRIGSGVGRRPFTIPEIQRVLEVADTEWRSLILFGLYSGQRLGDIVSLTWDNIDLERNELRFPKTIEIEKGKPPPSLFVLWRNRKFKNKVVAFRSGGKEGRHSG